MLVLGGMVPSVPFVVACTWGIGHIVQQAGALSDKTSAQPDVALQLVAWAPCFGAQPSNRMAGHIVAVVAGVVVVGEQQGVAGGVDHQSGMTEGQVMHVGCS